MNSILKHLNKTEANFIKENKIPENLFLDANGESQPFYKNLCKEMDIPFVYNAPKHSKCGNSIKNRNGHCIICNPDALLRYKNRYFKKNNPKKNNPYFLFFDVETTGLPKKRHAQISDSNNWPRIVQFAWIATNDKYDIQESKSFIIKPVNYIIPEDSSSIHGITNEYAIKKGRPIKEVLNEFKKQTSKATHLIAHNLEFDHKIVLSEFYRNNLKTFDFKPTICTMEKSKKFVGIKFKNGKGYKWPTLQELHGKLFNQNFDGAHDAYNDVAATVKSFEELLKRGIIKL